MGSRSTVTSITKSRFDYRRVLRVRFLAWCGILLPAWAVVFHLMLLTPVVDCESQYLLMKPITTAVATGKFEILKDHSTKKISVNLEAPFRVNGYLLMDKFVEDFKEVYSQYNITGIQWVTKQIENPFAVESLNLNLKNQRSQKSVNYKFIFFMTKVDDEWKIYYLKGLNF